MSHKIFNANYSKKKKHRENCHWKFEGSLLKNVKKKNGKQLAGYTRVIVYQHMKLRSYVSRRYEDALNFFLEKEKKLLLIIHCVKDDLLWLFNMWKSKMLQGTLSSAICSIFFAVQTRILYLKVNTIYRWVVV